MNECENITYVLDDLALDDFALLTFADLAEATATERKRSSLNCWVNASCAEAEGKAATKIREAVLIVVFSCCGDR